MDRHPLEGPRKRLGWSREHLYSLNTEVMKYLNGGPYFSLQETEAESGHEIWRIEIREPIPQNIGLLAGDCIHDMRAALDNLAWNFACIKTDPPPSNTAFITTHSPKQFDREKGKIEGVLPGAREVIEYLQPYRRLPDDPKRHPLWILNRLWNDDKHRVPAIFGSVALGSTLNLHRIANVGGFTPVVHYGPFKSNTEVARLEVERRDADSEVNVEAEFTLGVAFDEEGPTRGELVMPFLSRLYHYLRDEVFRRFEAVPLP